MMVASSFKVATANEGTTANENTTTEAKVASDEEAKTENYISALYKQIDFRDVNELSYDVFKKALNGYLNLRDAGKIEDGHVITICDFNLASNEPRMWVIDLEKRKVLFNTYVAHGKGSGDIFATKFSNKMNSHQTSLGFYVTGETYRGKNGLQLRLNGMDEGFNDDAYDRGVVLHGSKYISEDRIANGLMGRSLGCPAVASAVATPIINNIKGGSLLFIYANDTKYNTQAYWMNKKITTAPSDIYTAGITEEMVKPKTTTIEYIHNGKVDSVRIAPTVTN
jgi:hypothetical protein